MKNEEILEKKEANGERKEASKGKKYLNEESNGENEGQGYGPFEAMTEMFTNKDFINFAQESVDKITSAIGKFGERRDEQFYKVNRIFLWQRFILSLIAIIFLGSSAIYKWLPIESIIPLLGGVIASLFVTPKKE